METLDTCESVAGQLSNRLGMKIFIEHDARSSNMTVDPAEDAVLVNGYETVCCARFCESSCSSGRGAIRYTAASTLRHFMTNAPSR